MLPALSLNGNYVMTPSPSGPSPGPLSLGGPVCPGLGYAVWIGLPPIPRSINVTGTCRLRGVVLVLRLVLLVELGSVTELEVAVGLVEVVPDPWVPLIVCAARKVSVVAGILLQLTLHPVRLP